MNEAQNYIHAEAFAGFANMTKVEITAAAACILMGGVIWLINKAADKRNSKKKEDKRTRDLASYFISTFKENGFTKPEIVKILGCKKRQSYYGIENNKEDQAAVCIALEILRPTRISQ